VSLKSAFLKVFLFKNLEFGLLRFEKFFFQKNISTALFPLSLFEIDHTMVQELSERELSL